MKILMENSAPILETELKYYDFMYELTTAKTALLETTAICDGEEILTGSVNEVSLKNAKEAFVRIWKLLIQKIQEIVSVIKAKLQKDKASEKPEAAANDEKLNEAIKEKRINNIRSLIKGASNEDLIKNSNMCKEYIDYVLKNGITEEELFDEHDNESFESNRSKWDKEYYNKVMSELLFNFSRKRIEHVIDIVEQLDKNAEEAANKANKYIAEYAEIAKMLKIGKYDEEKINTVLANFDRVKELFDNKIRIALIDTKKLLDSLNTCKEVIKKNVENPEAFIQDENKDKTAINNTITKLIQDITFIVQKTR